VTKVLVVDDETSIRWLINKVLSVAGYEVLEAGDGAAALALFDGPGGAPDLVVLDRMMPDMDGLAVLSEIRRRGRGDTPVIMLTGLAGESDRIRGLDGGADDYLAKPFSLGELEARVRALLRRAGGAGVAPGADPLVIDRPAREVRLHGSVVAVTRKEFDLLCFLADHPRRVLSIATLLEQVWQSSVEWQDPNTVKEHVRRLRHKLEPDPSNPVLIRTVRGAGFIYESGALAPAPAPQTAGV
jgi:two-component system, OmpR family, phosphate regulon response regulator PhoB